MKAGVHGLAAAVLLALGTLGCAAEPPPGVPGVVSRVVCQGLPQQVCAQAAETTGAVKGTVAQVVVHCSSPVCTVEQGEADVTIVFADGRREQSSYGWSSTGQGAGQPPIPVITQPPLPVQPVCIGVPFQNCLEMATTGPDGAGADATVGSITVRCTGTCTPAGGQGQTTYEFTDGSPAQTTDWSYQGGG